MCPWARENGHSLCVFLSALFSYHKDTGNSSLPLSQEQALPCVWPSCASEPEFPLGASGEGEGGPARNCCLRSFLDTRHPPQSGKFSPLLQEGRAGALSFVVARREPLQRSRLGGSQCACAKVVSAGNIGPVENSQKKKKRKRKRKNR